MDNKWIEQRVVVGASKVLADNPASNDMFFLVLLPEDHDDNVERYGMTYKEYRVPHHIFKTAISHTFPYSAEVEMVTQDGYRRPKIGKFKVI